jgi:ubiquinone/menaquinone biosynthesis C-methylase UbiE
MNKSHSDLTDWALSHVTVDRQATVLDVGCGGGRTIEKLAGQANSVYGIDYAAGSVAGSRAHNRRLIEEGRVRVEQASVSQLPFADNSFNLVTAIETQYYWPDPVNDMREVLRVLKPGGRMVVVGGSAPLDGSRRESRWDRDSRCPATESLS